jgi:hypothetical protein
MYPTRQYPTGLFGLTLPVSQARVIGETLTSGYALTYFSVDLGLHFLRLIWCHVALVSLAPEQIKHWQVG